MIHEVIVTTMSKSGEVHIAPMGIRFLEKKVVISPFRPSQTLDNILESEDVFSTIECLKKLGIKIKKVKIKKYKVFGKGLGSLSAKPNTYLNFVHHQSHLWLRCKVQLDQKYQNLYLYPTIHLYFFESFFRSHRLQEKNLKHNSLHPFH